MIYIKKIFPDDHSVMIRVEGTIDCTAIATLDEICKNYLKTRKRIQLDLTEITYISRDGREFLQKIKNKVLLTNIPAFMKVQETDFEK